MRKTAFEQRTMTHIKGDRPRNNRSKIEVPRDVQNSKSENMTSSGEIDFNITTNASPK